MKSRFTLPGRWLTCGSLALSLAACGGSDGEPVAQRRLVEPAHTASAALAETPTFKPASSEPPSAQTLAAQKEGGRLNSEELARIAKTGVLPKAAGGKLLSGADPTTAKAATARTTVYRFFNTITQAHFFTANETERDNVRNTQPHMTYEGPAFHASAVALPGLSPVYRFYNTQTGVHFYTISEDERANTLATAPQFNLEGVAYYASTLEGSGYTPLFRFFYGSKGFHFYTNSAAEKDNIIATLPQYTFEGIGYYMLGDDWIPPAIPHSGVTSAQCYQAGSNFLGACSTAGALALNPQQDGHRAAINPMSYSQLPVFPGTALTATWSRTSCVKDNVTGLVWEGKTDDGLLRDKDNHKTHLGNGLIGDTSGYIAAVNNNKLCGFEDWRLPTREELMGIVHFGVPGSPSIDTDWFPNTISGPYWTSVPYAPSATLQHMVDFSNGSTSAAGGGARPVRLVRGAPWTGPRYMITSAAYAGDEANNAVIDRRTGLTWRRCVEGQLWNGSTCASVKVLINHETALIRAHAESGWRLPNMKELSALPDLSLQNPAMDATAFPNTPSDHTWSSTPQVSLPGNAGTVRFLEGFTMNAYRPLGFFAVRLVRIDP